MSKKSKWWHLGLLILVVGLVVHTGGTAAAAPPKGEPIVIGYVGMVASPGTRPCMDIQKMAVEEINAKGGILGRPVVYKVQDGKGDTSLSVEALRKLVIEDKAKMVSVEGRTEICLAVQEASAMLFKEYPHILVFNGPMGSELTARIVDEPGKYEHCFRSWDPEPAHYAQMKYFFTYAYPKIFGVKKLAILWEDLAWTELWRRGIAYINLPTWEKLAQDCGLQVVYSKPVKPRGTMYFPILQQIAAAKADMILYISSWFTDTESFAKQWADSAAKDIQITLYGGVAQTQDYWRMTGGKGLGAISSYTDLVDTPVTPLTIPLVKKAHERKIPMQIHVHLAYADIYHFKNAVEKAKGVDDINKLIKAMEDVQTPHSLGKIVYQKKRVKPWFHSHARVYPEDPYKTYPGHYYQLIGQFQHDGKFVFLHESCPENEPAMRKFLQPEKYKKPAELRAGK
ncbi:MAG: ABC transporter substrate-binding protein [Syntrophales bacterium]|nr:ABC transporter substrate-binding protein [Syntrophales bacterium]